MKVNKNNEGIVFHSLDKRMAACGILLQKLSKKVSNSINIKPIPKDKNKCPNLDKCLFCNCWE